MWHRGSDSEEDRSLQECISSMNRTVLAGRYDTAHITLDGSLHFWYARNGAFVLVASFEFETGKICDKRARE